MRKELVVLALISVALASGCVTEGQVISKSPERVVMSGDSIRVEYEGRLENGDIFDSSQMHGKTLDFTAGAGQMIKGFDSAVIGMTVGEEKEITLNPEDAYGEYDPTLVRRFPKGDAPPGIAVGDMIALSGPGGAQIPATVTEVTDDEVVVDMNHELAGKVLIFKIKVIDISG